MRFDAVDAVHSVLNAERPRRSLVGVLVATFMAGAALPAPAMKRRKKDRRRKKGKGKNTTGRCKSRHSENEVLGFIAKAAKKYGQSQKVMERVARCESGLDPCAVNRSGPYYGLYQFLKSTWKTTPYKSRSIWDPEAQALAAAWMWKQGRKNEWACQ
jgi:soluble lytic murein transglycosylase-like protein